MKILPPHRSGRRGKCSFPLSLVIRAEPLCQSFLRKSQYSVNPILIKSKEEPSPSGAAALGASGHQEIGSRHNGCLPASVCLSGPGLSCSCAGFPRRGMTELNPGGQREMGTEENIPKWAAGLETHGAPDSRSLNQTPELNNMGGERGGLPVGLYYVRILRLPSPQHFP